MFRRVGFQQVWTGYFRVGVVTVQVPEGDIHEGIRKGLHFEIVRYTNIQRKLQVSPTLFFHLL